MCSASRAASRRSGSCRSLPDSHKAFIDHLHANLQFGHPMNSTHYFWDALIADFRAPFIKRELIRLNPQGIVHAWRWPELIARHGDYDVSLIRRHLQAT